MIKNTIKVLTNDKYVKMNEKKWIKGGNYK
jgi:hypothetical protein